MAIGSVKISSFLPVFATVVAPLFPGAAIAVKSLGGALPLPDAVGSGVCFPMVIAVVSVVSAGVANIRIPVPVFTSQMCIPLTMVPSL
ncbi:MAG: hypothetical protein C0616_00460 [Desulfuromonas sp.]|nr:MAG: hypothetical protein C0616_00460 [Desulfuromonas sp.]